MTKQRNAKETIVFAYVEDKPVAEVVEAISKLTKKETTILINYYESLVASGIVTNAALNAEYVAALKAHAATLKDERNWFKLTLQGALVGAATFGVYMLTKSRFNQQ